VLGRSSVSDLSEHVFDLIQELFAIDPHLLLSVMPQLEFKLKVGLTNFQSALSFFF
jgi:sister-chromatid-cohesion protein PDS5